MIFHVANELPKPKQTELNHELQGLTDEEQSILKKQIRRNTLLIEQFVSRLDLLLNKEKYPRKAEFIGKIRSRLDLLMEENDTFRKVLWKHYQSDEISGRHVQN